MASFYFSGESKIYFVIVSVVKLQHFFFKEYIIIALWTYYLSFTRDSRTITGISAVPVRSEKTKSSLEDKNGFLLGISNNRFRRMPFTLKDPEKLLENSTKLKCDE